MNFCSSLLRVGSFNYGGGVSQHDYEADLIEGLERLTAPTFENKVVQLWMPRMPRLQSMLEQGVSVADIGCGNGRALIKLAQAFPNSRFTGYDIFEPAIKQARKNAVEAGVSDRVTFQTIVPNQSMPVKFDVITTFDVLHDSADPDQLVRTIYYALKPEGIYVCLEINSADTVEEMAGPLGALLYGYSVLYCMTTSLAAGGAGLGTVGLPESKLRRLIMAHNFSDFRRVVDDDPFSVVYEINK